ncbi:S41 family peptidase [Pendulispora brunnea]|uniref:S41 family peptidase n=1 Tax=Pendulispora brunnea TaxID=2905690 RepID=A0ABZ2JZ75_9BACT
MKYSIFTAATVLAAAAVFACSDKGTSTDEGFTTEALEGADAWCARVAAGPPGAGDLRIELSTAHANVRFFGPHPTFNEVDQAFAAGLGEAGPIVPKRALATYAARLGGAACALNANPKPLGPAQVIALGPVAIVRPGTGRISLPQGTRAVLVDLHGLPAVDGLRSALEAAVAPALASPVPRATSHVRQHFGMTDETQENEYLNSIESVAQDAIPSTGSSDLPLVLLTAKALAPEAAELAITLRLANRAWIAGESVRAEAAESRWTPVKNTGLAWRAQELYSGDARWPDEVPADFSAQTPEQAAVRTSGLGAPPPITAGASNRAKLEPIVPGFEPQPETLGLGEARASLLAMHGATRRFFPYFHVVGDHIDERLQETMDAIEALPSLDRTSLLKQLRRFGEVLHDGHVGAADWSSGSTPTGFGYFPAKLEDVNGEPVVRRTIVEGVHPGDTITRIGNTSVAEWYARERPLVSGATEGWIRERIMRSMLRLQGPTEFGLRAPDGTSHTVTVQPVSAAAFLAFGTAAVHRAPGWLSDLGAPKLYYTTMTEAMTGGRPEFRRTLAEARDAEGLILDMRGYPAFGLYDEAMRLIPHAFSSPIFNFPVVRPASQTFQADHYDFDPLTDPSYAGPIVLLIGPQAISAAENFSIMLVDAKRLTAIVGRRSAGTNGNITTLFLPGAFSFTFTGMEILHTDRSRFHGIGIVPDIEVTLNAQDFQQGIDPELARAIDVLRAR